MIIHKPPFCAIFLLICSCSPNSNEPRSSLEPCVGLANSGERIICYDSVATDAGYTIPADPAVRINEKISRITEIAHDLGLPAPRVIGSDNTYLAELILGAAASNDFLIPAISAPLTEPDIDELLDLAESLTNAYDRARFSELVLVITPRKAAVGLSIQNEGVSNIDELDGGSFLIPDDVEVSYSMHGAEVSNGKIVMTWKRDFSEFDGVTYTLEPESLKLPISWIEGGTCLELNLC